MKRYFFVSLFIFLIHSFYAYPNYPLNVKGKEAMSIGIHIYDLQNDSTIFEYDSNRALTPASITKAVISASALSLLESNFAFETKVSITGEIKNGILYGDVIVDATGDATLESSHFPSNQHFVDSIIYNIKKLGINCIEGKCSITPNDFILDCGVNPSWEIEDIAWGYGAGYYPFNYKNNTFGLSISESKTNTSPTIKDLSIIKYNSLDNSSINLMRPFNSNDLYLQGNIGKTYSATCAMPYPEDVFIDELYSNLSQSGISILGNTLEGISKKRTIYTHYSPNRDDILKSLMVRSDNLFAESMLRALAQGKSRELSLKTQLNLWKSRGLDTEFILINDGSGLARSNRITPIFMTNLLKWMANSNYSQTYVNYFPIAGKDGTMKNFLKGSKLNGKIALKTGSMNGVQCYAGYKLDSNNKPSHTIVIMVNNFFCKRAELKSEIEKMLLDIF